MGIAPKYSGIKTILATLIVFHTILPGRLLAQTNVVLQMDQMLGTQPFTYGPTAEAELGYYFNVSRLQYYVSGITLIHDGGQQTTVPDLYLLVDPANDSIFQLGSFPVTDLEQIEFWIGVDSANNHLDPTLYPENHPLALHDPSMHWGWAGGYRFIAFEGVAGFTPGFLSGNYQIHTIGDENYRKIVLDVDEILDADTMIIPIQADYAMLLHKVDVSRGWESHSSVGKSKQISMNMRHVFTPVILSSAYHNTAQPHVLISPNPADDFISISIPQATIGSWTVTITHLNGKIVLNEKSDASAQRLDLPVDLVPGMYFVTLSDGQEILAVKKIVVR